ncbi:hypothetical protein DFH08DRAFT_817456 [Mycena albidolilacea]|uniref:Uncharacterized protein n=1 Tax=Mycena albidolilacea TaxID=1033008 RepID=A0AAD6ZII1_9AGAR|nr:hypothetical protein DFH08DRAFT_817456 [Mycena albidolilacea]
MQLIAEHALSVISRPGRDQPATILTKLLATFLHWMPTSLPSVILTSFSRPKQGDGPPGYLESTETAANHRFQPLNRETWGNTLLVSKHSGPKSRRDCILPEGGGVPWSLDDRKGRQYDERGLDAANYVFSRFGITSNFEDFVLLHSIDFDIFVPSSTQETPTGFLFVCPAENFQITPSSFCWPEYPAYWSRDGVERLSTEEAVRLGFPVLEFNTRILGLSRDSSVYAGPREFLQTKAFNPDTQDYAKRNNWPLLQLSTRRENLDADGHNFKRRWLQLAHAVLHVPKCLWSLIMRQLRS